MDLNFLMKTLYENKELKTLSQAKTFISTLETIEKFSLKPDIKTLLLFYNDNVNFIDALKELDRIIWSFDWSNVISALVEITLEIYQVAPEWTEMIYIGIVRDETPRGYLVAVLSALDEKKRQATYEVLERLSKNSVLDQNLQKEINEKIENLLAQI